MSHPTYDCLICAEPCTVFGVFSCGHYTCVTCALRIALLSKSGCPVCREKKGKVIATRRRPVAEDGFDIATQFCDEKTSASGGASLRLCQSLDCLVDGDAVLEYVSRLYEFVCPMVCCWDSGEQEPFSTMSMLQEHLRVDHKLSYCDICLRNRPAFLSEQMGFTEHEMDQHYRGTCSKKDPPSFLGHPPCRFCTIRLYDGEQLLKHMQHSHFSCDVCNTGEFTFTYYKNRAKLLEHFERCHKLCDHVDCANLDPMLRVFRSDMELQAHRQRVHGQAARGVALESLGFRFSVTDSLAGGQQGASGGLAASSTGGAFGAGQPNQQAASIITFDHVSRREQVDIFPTNQASRGGNGGKKGGRKGQQRVDDSTEEELVAAAIASVEEHKQSTSHRFHQGIPPHYLSRKLRFEQIQHSSPAQASAAHHHHQHSPVKPQRLTAAPEATSDPRSFQKALEEHLRQMNPKLLADFRYFSGEFLSGKVLAAEYYDALCKVFFPRPEALEAVFPILVGTLPVEGKRDALMQIRRMRTAPEALRQEKAREEEEGKARQREIAQSVRDGRNTKSKAKTWGQAAPPPPAGNPGVDDGQPRGSVAWGGRQAPPPVLSPVHVDPLDFPTLPGSGGGSGQARRHGPPAPSAKKGNVWFAKNSH
jgi:hypothetical protein